MKNKTSKSEKPLSRQKIFLAIAFLLFSCLILSISLSQTFFKQEKNIPSVTPPNYQKLFRQAILEYESAESALIYKDEEKAKYLLESSKRKARSVMASPNLNIEANELIEKIEEKERELQLKTNKD